LSVLEEYETPYLGIAEDSTSDFYKILNFDSTDENGETQEFAVSVMSMNDIVQEGSTVTENRAGILNSTMSVIREKIFDMAQSSDLVVIYLHFGEINSVNVTEDQRILCQELIDAGADIVVGSHSRMVQPIERYGDGLIVYDLGEVISSSDYSVAMDGALLDITVLHDGTVSAYLTPTRIKESRPYITDSQFYQKRITKMLTANLEKNEFFITDTGAVKIPLGQLDQ
jgi:poly-gamma-glutamate synthesis protein (capsule biosynthesis protein)